MTENMPAKKSKKGLIALIAIVAIIAAIAVVVTTVILPKLTPAADYAYYFEGDATAGRAWFGSVDTAGESAAIGTELQLDSLNGYDLRDKDTNLTITQNRKADLLFYPANVAEDGSFSLYCRPLSDPTAEAVLLDTRVSRYAVNKDGDVVTYLKDGDLYQRLPQSREFVFEGATDFFASENADVVLVGKDKRMYYFVYNGPRRELDSGVTSIASAAFTFDRVFYFKEKTFYKTDLSGNTERIDTDVDDVIHDADGQVYYSKNTKIYQTLLDYIEDDFDRRLQPQYAAKAETLRRSLQEVECYHTLCDLYYYDGGSTYPIYENMLDSRNVLCADGVPTIAYTAYQGDLGAVYSLSRLVETVNSVPLQQIEAHLMKTREVRVAAYGTDSAPTASGITTCKLSKDGTKLFFITKDDNGVATMCKADIDNSGYIANVTGLCSNVSDDALWVLDDGRVMYTKIEENGEYSCYIDDKMFVYEPVVGAFGHDGGIYYFADYDTETGLSALWYYGADGNKKVSDNVCQVGFSANDKLLYITDGRSLFVYTDGKSRVIDDEVAAILIVEGE